MAQPGSVMTHVYSYFVVRWQRCCWWRSCWSLANAEAMPGDPADQRGEIVGGPAHLPFILFFLVCVMSCFAATPSDVRRWLLVLLLGRCLEVSQPHDPFVSSGYLASVGAYSHNLHQRSRDLMQNVRMLGCDARDL